MLLYLVKQVELAVRARLDELLRPDGLTALQYTALTVLERHPDMSVAQLARNSFVTAQSMADMVAALEDRGLIERHRDQADRRRLAIALSPAGHEFLDRYRDPVNVLESRMLHGTTKPQVTCPAPHPHHLPRQPGPRAAPITVSCAGWDCGSNGVSGPIAPGVMTWRERCRDDRDTG
jgi:DNA-binding MarR family transcriptional regulator